MSILPSTLSPKEGFFFDNFAYLGPKDKFVADGTLFWFEYQDNVSSVTQMCVRMAEAGLLVEMETYVKIS